MNFSKLNWRAGIFKSTVVVASILFVYEFILQPAYTRNYLSGAPLIFKFIIPVAAVFILYVSFKWALNGLFKPSLNWDEGLNRLSVVLLGIFVIAACIFFIMAGKTIYISFIFLVIIGAFLVAWIIKGLQKSEDE